MPDLIADGQRGLTHDPGDVGLHPCSRIRKHSNDLLIARYLNLCVRTDPVARDGATDGGGHAATHLPLRMKPWSPHMQRTLGAISSVSGSREITCQRARPSTNACWTGPSKVTAPLQRLPGKTGPTAGFLCGWSMIRPHFSTSGYSAYCGLSSRSGDQVVNLTKWSSPTSSQSPSFSRRTQIALPSLMHPPPVPAPERLPQSQAERPERPTRPCLRPSYATADPLGS